MKVQLEVTWPRGLTLGRRYRRLKAAAVALGVALVVAVPIAWASHDFGDVPDDHQFHSQISAIKGAGITTGCGGGNYCPNDFVRRDAMAAFMQRGFGRAAASSAFVDNTIEASATEATDTVVSQVTITVPGAGAATQFVKIDGHVLTGMSTGDAPTFLAYYLADTTCNSGNTSPYFEGTIRDADVDTHSISWVFAAPPGAHNFRLCAWTGDGHVLTGSATALVATTYPFGSTGFSTLATQGTKYERPTG